jgi:signal transduction histidine kinase
VGSLFWHLTSRTAETEFIFNLFHFLVAGLTLLVLLHQAQPGQDHDAHRAHRLLTAGFLLIAVQCALLGLHFGALLFLHIDLNWAGPEALSRGLLAFGVVVIAAGYVRSAHAGSPRRAWALAWACTLIAALTVAAVLGAAAKLPHARSWQPAMSAAGDLLALAAVIFGIASARRDRPDGRRATILGLTLLALFLVLQSVSPLLPHYPAILAWNAEQHLLSTALFAFAWAAGERSRNLLDRTFVRLNLTFIILASLIMLITTGMEKVQYLRLAEQRSLELAEFLRGHIAYDRSRGNSLQAIFSRPDVMRHVVVEFGRLPELREINVYMGGDRASFYYTPALEVKQEIVPTARSAHAVPANSFEMVRLPIAGPQDGDRIELVGTMDYINQNIGQYIIAFYLVFTVVVILATGIIGMIVADADRRLRRQYAELQDTQQQLAHAAKLASVGELAGGMAHEINTPITSILTLASHFAEGKGATALTPPQRHNWRTIVDQAKRISDIVTNLLTFSRRSHIELSRVDLVDALETALSLVRLRLTSGSVALQKDIDSDLPPILGDERRLTEVFVNLLNNALDAMPSGGTVLVRASHPQADGVRVEIGDTGCGIAAADLPRIFDPFFTTKAPGRGTGLGLSISHGIVEDHGGQIRVRSTPGVGTTLTVTLPTEGTSQWPASS